MKISLADQIEYEGKISCVVAVTVDTVTLRGLDEAATREVLIEDLWREAKHADAPKIAEPGLDFVERLDPPRQEEALFWLDHLQNLQSQLTLAEATGRTKREVMAECADRLMAAGRPITVRALYKRLARFRVHGAVGLVDARLASVAPPSRRIDSRVISALGEVMASQRTSSTGTRARLIELTRRLLADRFADDVVMPGRSTMYRLIEEMDRGQHVTGSAKTRRSIANRPQRQFLVSGAVRPGEQVQIDSTKLDVMIELPDGKRVRPELTIMLDVATRSIIAAIVRPIATKSIDLVVLLARALTPYDRRPGGEVATRQLMSASLEGALTTEDEIAGYRRRMPLIFPSTITTDRGAIFVSRHFHAVCEAKGIDLNLAAPYTPTDKGIVERTLQSINTRFTQYLSGYTGRGVEFRGTDEPKELLSLQQLQQLVDEWIAVDWQERPHDALRDPVFVSRLVSPNQMARAARELIPEVVIPMDEAEYIRLMPRQWRTVQQYGVTIENRTYDSEALAPIRRMKSPHRAQDGKWPIRHDPYNVQVVWLELEDELIPLQWMSPHVDGPMSADVWAAVRRRHTRGRDPVEEAKRAALLADLLQRGANPRAEDRKALRAAARGTAVQAELPVVVFSPPRGLATFVSPTAEGLNATQAEADGMDEDGTTISTVTPLRVLTDDDEGMDW